MQEFGNEFADFWYSIPQDIQTAGGCWVVRAGQNIAKPSYHVGPKVIEQISIHWILQGSVRVTNGHQIVILSRGDLFCLFPGISYVYETMEASNTLPLQMAWLAMEGDQLPLMLADLGLSTAVFWTKGIVNPTVIGAIHSVLELFEKQEHDPLREQSLLFDLFWKMKISAKGSTSVAGTHWLDQVKAYLDLHFTENIRIEDAARQVGIHRSHLSVAFVKKFGCSPQHYLQKLRMEKGARLLRECDWSVTEVALSLGYPELYAFTRTFTKYYGVSPRAYKGQLG
ncbi:hypothetical protein GCM10008018_26450 [Paenibacillus marchantiophytorum]|uniref:HTH araC/xylS-type domain-containing protein n=1 Tax=Paenibacillus marchantiophytorum TaxID=1619310 RepID=A0ABQ1EN94_9BACL|nr:AraC family transcriptional regulator [Paenibacillus marchantiophytorum]GFZ79612.1 hypothetical protein GCM10008018_26450 [Paenibacillus marchantiophytorum]